MSADYTSAYSYSERRYTYRRGSPSVGWWDTFCKSHSKYDNYFLNKYTHASDDKGLHHIGRQRILVKSRAFFVSLICIILKRYREQRTREIFEAFAVYMVRRLALSIFGQTRAVIILSQL